jgi:hypothetical protein
VFFIPAKKGEKLLIFRRNACHYSGKPCSSKKNKNNRCILLFFCGIIIERLSKGEQ